jgi:flagellar basal body rod protein FlgG
MADYSETALVRSLNYLAEMQGAIAHNLANAASTAYKRRVPIAEHAGLEFASMLQQRMPTVVYRETTDYGDGQLRPTDERLHVALQGDGFLRVRGADGSMFLTRNGEMVIDREGYLATTGGLRYLDRDGAPINLSADGAPPSSLLISPDGSISDASDATQAHGQLGIVAVDRADRLQPAGTSMYRLPPETPMRPGTARVQQRHVEQSNVDSLSELINMIIVQRSFEATSRTLRTIDELKSSYVTAMNR